MTAIYAGVAPSNVAHQATLNDVRPTNPAAEDNKAAQKRQRSTDLRESQQQLDSRIKHLDTNQDGKLDGAEAKAGLLNASETVKALLLQVLDLSQQVIAQKTSSGVDANGAIQGATVHKNVVTSANASQAIAYAATRSFGGVDLTA